MSDLLLSVTVALAGLGGAVILGLALEDADATVALLDRADPSVGERLVDRFTRLVDALLAE